MIHAMFQDLQLAPPDPILGLTAAFKEDPRANKINLSVGVYQDSAGRTPVLECVKAAERRMAERESTKDYLPIDGSGEYNTRVRALMLGEKHEAATSGRALTAHTPGGTAALRVAADFIKQKFPTASVWLSKPTWANHPSIFEAAGVPTKTYAYFDAASSKLDIDAMLSDLKRIPAGDVVLLHGCCHNPSGIDPTRAEWKRIADVVHARSLLPLVDFAYQGFGDGLDEDAVGLLELCRPGSELLIANSFSKNFGLYCERVGGLTVVAANADAAKAAMSHVKRAIRANYSNPPLHGAAIVGTILGDAELRKRWLVELAQMRDRINGMRHTFVETMKRKTPQRDFSFIAGQRGMFSFSGLTPAQVDELRSKHAIYIVGNGRINVAGMTPANLEPLCDAIASVL
jgi:aspartate/tyrosine/aromatic aminotransferase